MSRACPTLSRDASHACTHSNSLHLSWPFAALL